MHGLGECHLERGAPAAPLPQHVQLIDHNEPQLRESLRLDEAVDQRVTLLYGCHVETEALEAAPWRVRALARGVLLYDKVKVDGERTQTAYLGTEGGKATAYRSEALRSLRDKCK